MSYNFLIGNKSNYSEDPSKRRQTYQKSFLKSLAINSKATFEPSYPSVLPGGSNPPLDPFPTVKIGTQTWSLYNLDIAYYNNGDIIQQVTDQAQWESLTTGAWCYYDNNASNATTYGRLYNWYAITDPRGVAPNGWRVPTRDDFDTLATYLGGSPTAGELLKESGLSHWTNPNLATNSTGFTALPSGYRYTSFLGIQEVNIMWSSTQFSSPSAYYRYMLYNDQAFYESANFKYIGAAVRLVKN